MLRSAALLVTVVAATPALAQEGARTDVATVKKLVAQAATVARRGPVELALGLVQVNLSCEIEQALHARPAPALKVAPR